MRSAVMERIAEKLHPFPESLRPDNASEQQFITNT